MKKLQMTPPDEGPDLGIVREFEDDHAKRILEKVTTWKSVPKNTPTTPGYALSPSENPADVTTNE